jgi:uncharacterized protein (TIGR02246 family)
MTDRAIATVRRQYDAYNARDADAYADCFAPDCIVSNLNGSTVLSGATAIRERYMEIFSGNPENKTTLLNRIALGNIVIDHERVDRKQGETAFQIVAIYTVHDDRIARVDFVKQEP